jgi:hypothetical protein
MQTGVVFNEIQCHKKRHSGTQPQRVAPGVPPAGAMKLIGSIIREQKCKHIASAKRNTFVRKFPHF